MSNKIKILLVFLFTLIAPVLFIHMQYPILFELIKFQELEMILKGLWSYESYMTYHFYHGGGAYIDINETTINETHSNIQININELDNINDIYVLESNSVRHTTNENNSIYINNTRKSQNINIIGDDKYNDYTIGTYQTGEKTININSISEYPINKLSTTAYMNKESSNNNTMNVNIGWRDLEGENIGRNVPSKVNGVQFDETYIDKLEYHVSNGDKYTIQEIGENKNISIDKKENIALVYVNKDGDRRIQECMKNCL